MAFCLEQMTFVSSFFHPIYLNPKFKMYSRLFLKTIYLSLGIFLLPNLLGAENDLKNAPAPQSIFDKLHQRDVIELVIKTNLDSLINHRATNDYIPATFTHKIGKSEESWDIEVKPRGKYRRRVCDFPPLKLNFSKKDLKAKGLTTYDKLKLVTHCIDEKIASKDLVLREYMAYELYRELTENSYRVQLAKITYIDSGSGKKTKRWGFLIESTDQLAARMSSVEVEEMGHAPEDFHIAQERITSTFQYMIGNEDWNLEMNRNVKVFKNTKSGKLIAVPYDFDFSGLVNAPYAVPNSSLGLASIRERSFLGLSEDVSDLYSTYSYFRTKKKALTDRINKFRLLSTDSKQDMINYIESFYEIINEGIAQEGVFPNRI